MLYGNIFAHAEKGTPPACLPVGLWAVPITGDHWIAAQTYLQTLCQNEMQNCPNFAQKNSRPHNTGGDFTYQLWAIKNPPPGIPAGE